MVFQRQAQPVNMRAPLALERVNPLRAGDEKFDRPAWFDVLDTKDDDRLLQAVRALDFVRHALRRVRMRRQDNQHEGAAFERAQNRGGITFARDDVAWRYPTRPLVGLERRANAICKAEIFFSVTDENSK